MFNNNNLLKDLFLHEKPVKILLGLRNEGNKSYASSLAKYADCTYSHAVKILESFENLGLITFKKHGRVKYIKLTDEGEQLAFNLESLVKKMEKLSID